MQTLHWQVLAFAVVAAALLESGAPHHAPRGPATRRIVANAAFLGLGALLSIWLVPASRFVDQWWLDSVGPGLTARLPQSLPLTLAVAFVGYDLQRYIAHRMFHTPLLWRLHALHHSDPDVDWSTNLRHHPLEAIAAMLLAAVGLGLLGIDASTIAALALVHMAWDMFVHANVALPRGLERRIGWLLVTPAMHRLHHSASRVEADSNFGGMLSIWDRMFGTLRHGEPARFGLEVAEPSAQARLVPMLLLPFARVGSTRSIEEQHKHNPIQET